jgi:predicted ATPase/transcriptional regulator with XRE-family HTH domain
MYDDMIFGQRVRQHRRELDLTQEDFAQRVGIATETVSKIERGERRPSRHVAERMAQVLELSAEDRAAFVRAARALLNDAADPPPVPPPMAESRRMEGESLRMEGQPLPAVAVPRRPRVQLPTPATALVGRATELAELERLLADPGCRLLTVSGPGGIGKTRLAIEATARQAARFADGVAFVALASVSAPDLIAPAIADALGFSFYGQANPTGQLIDFLQEKALLLVLDNFEHLVEGADFLVELIQCAPQVKLIATSRERLNLQGEWVIELQGLPLPRNADGWKSGDQLAGFDDSAAVALFLQTARRTYAGFTLAPADRAAVARICRLVDGMPLGIELAAAWVRVLPLSEIADEIARTLDFLAASVRDLPARHRSLRAVFDHSWNLLTDQERIVMRRLSVFRGGFSRAAVAAVMSSEFKVMNSTHAAPELKTMPSSAAKGQNSELLTILASLVDKSLLRRSGSGRYDMHELVRQYAATHLDAESDEYTATRDRHAAFYMDLVQRRESELKRARQKAVLDELVAEIDNLRLAWDWAATHAQLAELGGAVRGFSWFYELRSWFQEGETLFAHAVAALGGADDLAGHDPARAVVIGQLMTFEGWFRFRQGRYVSACDLLERTVALLRPLGDKSALADALACQGMALNLMGEYRQARLALEEGLALGRELQDSWAIILCLGTLGMVAYGLGEYQESERLCRQGLAESLSTGSVRAVVFSISALMLTTFAQGRYDEAQALVRASFATSSAIGDFWGIGSALLQLGRVAYIQGEYDEAHYLYRESCATFRDIGDRWSMARALNGLAETAVALGDRPAALQHFRDAWRVASEARVTPVAMEILAGLADLLADQGAVVPARELIAYILGTPAASQAARDRAERLHTTLVGEAPSAPQRPLEQVLASAWNTR